MDPAFRPAAAGVNVFPRLRAGTLRRTAGHVYEQYLQDREGRRIGGTQVANIHFDPAERLIAWGKNLNLDVATFRITPAEIAASGKKIVRGIDGPWPPPPNEGEVVILAAFLVASAIELRERNLPLAFTPPWCH